MINRIFFISRHIRSFDSPELSEENVYYSLSVPIEEEGSLASASRQMEQARYCTLSLTLIVRQSLSADDKRQIASCLFIPGYCTIGGRPLINLSGQSAALLQETAGLLRSYIIGQGYREPIINLITDEALSFHTEASLEKAYPGLLNGQAGSHRNIYFYLPQEVEVSPLQTLHHLRAAEDSFRAAYPDLAALIRQNNLLENELDALRVRQAATAAELAHQQQYVKVLQSGNAAREIQSFYDREYEILPGWYKKFGHILKVLTGKRTLRSLFRDDVKKYKD